MWRVCAQFVCVKRASHARRPSQQALFGGGAERPTPSRAPPTLPSPRGSCRRALRLPRNPESLLIPTAPSSHSLRLPRPPRKHRLDITSYCSPSRFQLPMHCRMSHRAALTAGPAASGGGGGLEEAHSMASTVEAFGSAHRRTRAFLPTCHSCAYSATENALRAV